MVVALLLIALVLGLVLARQRRISLREEELERERGTAGPPPKRGGSYRADTGFDFSSGAEAPPRPEPPAPRQPPVVPPTPEPAAPPTPEPAAPPAPEPAAPPRRSPPRHRTARTCTTCAAPRRVIAEADRATVRSGSATGRATCATCAAPRRAIAEADRATDAASATCRATLRAAVRATRGPTGPAAGATGAGERHGARARPAVPGSHRTRRDRSSPPEGRLERLRGRLARSRSGFGQGLLGLLGRGGPGRGVLGGRRGHAAAGRPRPGDDGRAGRDAAQPSWSSAGSAPRTRPASCCARC